MHVSGSVVSMGYYIIQEEGATIIVGTGRGILPTHSKTLMKTFGGSIVLNKEWAECANAEWPLATEGPIPNRRSFLKIF